MSLISLICFIYYGKDLISMFVSPSGGEWDIIGFIYIPASFIFLGWLIVSLLLEHAFYKLGLIYGSFWGIYSLIGFPLVFLSLYHH